MVVHRVPKRCKTCRSARQLKRQNAFLRCKNLWMNSISVQDKNRWKYIANFPETAYNAFLRINLMRCFNDLEPYGSPPLDY